MHKYIAEIKSDKGNNLKKEFPSYAEARRYLVWVCGLIAKDGAERCHDFFGVVYGEEAFDSTHPNFYSPSIEDMYEGTIKRVY